MNIAPCQVGPFYACTSGSIDPLLVQYVIMRGTTSECSLYPEFRINCVCYNETPLYYIIGIFSIAIWSINKIYVSAMCEITPLTYT